MVLKNKRKHQNYDDLYDDLERIKSSLADATYDVKEKAVEILTDSYNDMKQHTAKVKDNITEYTADKPLKCLSIAALVGFAAGYFMRK